MRPLYATVRIGLSVVCLAFSALSMGCASPNPRVAHSPRAGTAEQFQGKLVYLHDIGQPVQILYERVTVKDVRWEARTVTFKLEVKNTGARKLTVSTRSDCLQLRDAEGNAGQKLRPFEFENLEPGQTEVGKLSYRFPAGSSGVILEYLSPYNPWDLVVDQDSDARGRAAYFALD